VIAPRLPTTAEIALLRQPGQAGRTVLHLIHYAPQRRGVSIDIVEDVLPLSNVRIGVRLCQATTGVSLAPSGEKVPHEVCDGVTWVTVPSVIGHQVVVYA
jgi:hypothetical protein